MYLRTPKRYARRRRGGFSLWRLLAWIMMIGLIVVGIGVYENRDIFAPEVRDLVQGIVSDVGGELDRINAPMPTPTPDTANDQERALAAWNRGSIQEAVSIYSRIVAFEPNNMVVHYQLAFGLIMEGRFEAALVAAEDAITADPYSPHGWTIRAMALNRLGLYGESLASAIQALSLIPRDDEANWAPARARVLAFQAEAYLNLELGERALSTVEQALEIYPSSPEAYQVRGQINQLINFDFEAARNDYEEAYALMPNYVYLGIWLARIEATTIFNNYDRALEIYQELAERNPGNPQVLLDLGTYYYRVDNDFNRAQEIFSRCVEADNQYSPCQYWLGRTYWEQEQQTLAVEALQTALNLDPDDALTMWWLGRNYRDLGQCPQAISYIQQGRQIAQQTNNTGLLEDFDWLAGQCGLAVQPQTETTPEAEATEAADA